MVLIIQTAFFGSARAMESMAKEENLPAIFGKTNTYGTPVIAMIVTALFNIALITLKSPAAVLAASAIGYICANGISLSPM
ncbi:amino acid permease [Desulfosporosinus acidiphilus]|uniref:amino acid permease n=1 Tax=Desulfosporosinus acidiphilus TaxID=885581 RepID=UPI0002FC99B4|nr:amino acid permease [Desulfosporosinus acidiphilus]